MSDLWKFTCAAGLCVIVVAGLLGVRNERLKRARRVALLDRAVGLLLGLPLGGIGVLVASQGLWAVVNASNVKEATDIAAAVGIVATAVIALMAASEWRKGLENQRIDEAISAVRELQSAIDAVISIMQVDARSPPDWSAAYTDAYRVSWRRFNQAYAVATRYYPLSLPAGAESDFAAALSDLRELWRHPDTVALDRLKARVHALARRIEEALRAAAPLVPR